MKCWNIKGTFPAWWDDKAPEEEVSVRYLTRDQSNRYTRCHVPLWNRTHPSYRFLIENLWSKRMLGER